MRHFESQDNFKIMLAERIKSYDCDYHDIKKVLNEDPRFTTE